MQPCARAEENRAQLRHAVRIDGDQEEADLAHPRQLPPRKRSESPRSSRADNRRDARENAQPERVAALPASCSESKSIDMPGAWLTSPRRVLPLSCFPCPAPDETARPPAVCPIRGLLAHHQEGGQAGDERDGNRQQNHFPVASRRIGEAVVKITKPFCPLPALCAIQHPVRLCQQAVEIVLYTGIRLPAGRA